MHLSAEDFVAHMKYVSTILKPDSYYIFTTLNPVYELKKIGHETMNGERYDFMHGKTGEHGVFYHYYKTSEFIKETIETYFEIKHTEPCIPISDTFTETHARYYDTEPMAHTYILRKKYCRSSEVR
jgi:hypothetical protein